MSSAVHPENGHWQKHTALTALGGTSRSSASHKALQLGRFRAKRDRAGRPLLTGRTLFLRVSASLNPIIDFFNAGSNSGLLQLEHRFTDDLRKSAPWINYPVPPRRRAFLHVKFCLAMPQESSSSFRSINTQRAFTNHHAPIPFP